MKPEGLASPHLGAGEGTSQPWCPQDPKQPPSSKEGSRNRANKGAFRAGARLSFPQADEAGVVAHAVVLPRLPPFLTALGCGGYDEHRPGQATSPPKPLCLVGTKGLEF